MSQPREVSIGGGDIPILLASHHAPRRASSISLWLPQCRRSGEYEIQTCAPRGVMGRWIKAQYPLILRGSRAASLSSGGMMTPIRSKLRKSSVRAKDTPGPPREYDVYAMAYFLSSATYVMRGSSMPHSSSGYCSGFGRSVGSRSICHSSTPFNERATHRCERPRRSSTRHSRSVEPSGRNVAPALKTLLMEYGQS